MAGLRFRLLRNCTRATEIGSARWLIVNEA